jgi:hypothetical protein
MLHGLQDTPLLAWQSRARALERWREAATLVETRWRAFREAEPESRRWAFASFVAALDAEEAAAAEMAVLSLDTAA